MFLSEYIILIPLNKAPSKKVGISLAGSAIALSTGLITTHCLVPPTPGPVAATDILNADLGLVIALGMFVGIFSAAAGWLFAIKIASKTYIDPEPDLSETDAIAMLKKAPLTFNAFIPIVDPILLIILKSFSDFPIKSFGDGILKNCIGFIGEPVIMLRIGILFAFHIPFNPALIWITYIGKTRLRKPAE